jgi:hypothetical protein
MSTPPRQTWRPFLFQPSAAAREAYGALVAVQQQIPAQDDVERVYAAVVARQRYEAFVRRYQVRPRRDTHVCLYRLLGASRCPDTYEEPCDSPHLLPGVDHMSEWLRGKTTYCLVSQPYNWDWRTMCATVDLGRRHGFEVQVSARASWHFPGWTTLVLYTRK